MKLRNGIASLPREATPKHSLISDACTTMVGECLKDAAEAAKWYLRAAHQGVHRAQFKLAYMYREGRGVPQDRVRAHMWFLVQKFVIDTEKIA